MINKTKTAISPQSFVSFLQVRKLRSCSAILPNMQVDEVYDYESAAALYRSMEARGSHDC